MGTDIAPRWSAPRHPQVEDPSAKGGYLVWYGGTLHLVPRVPRPVFAEARGNGVAPAHLVPALADFDGDGVNDIVTARNEQQLQWFRGLGGGAFAAGAPVVDEQGKPLQYDEESLGLMLVDWNQDGHLDLLVNNAFTWLTVHLGSAKGFGPGQRVMAGDTEITADGFGAAWLGDFDGDRVRDLVVPGRKGSVLIYRGQRQAPEPVLGPAETLLPENEEFTYAWLAVTDWTGDGKPDLLLSVADNKSPDYVPLTREEQGQLEAAKAELERIEAEVAQLNRTPPDFAAEAYAKRMAKREELGSRLAGPKAVKERLTDKAQGKPAYEGRLGLFAQR